MYHRYHLYCLILAIGCVVYGVPSFALIDTASAGNWSSSGIWQSGTSPGNGDTLVIPVGVTVTVNCNCGTYSDMYIMVFGTLDFPNGKKINMSANGLVDMFPGGKVTGGNGGSKLNIGGSTVWDGNDADMNGPWSCNSSGCGSNAALPIELLYLRHNRVQLHPIEVEWATGSETNNDFFTLYKSQDFETWDEVTIIAGVGNSTNVIEYQYIDFLDRLSDASYIKLDQTDFDGQVVTAGVLDISVNNKTASARVYPNPSNGSFNISFVEGKAFKSIQILDSKGQVIGIKDASTVVGPNISFSIEERGVYQLLISDDLGNVETLRAIVLD